jgi:putative ATP-dependent endonuclease of OLD family
MRIESIRIRNLRSFVDETIHLDDYTCLVGQNGAGKSTVLFALNIFFREPSVTGAATGVLTEEDFHGKATEDPIEITVTFGDIEPTAAEDLKHYVRGGKLVVSSTAHFNKDTREAKVEQHGQRNVMPDFRPFFRAFDDNAKADELNKLYSDLQRRYSELPKATSKEAKRDVLREYEEAHPDLCELSPSADQFYGFTKGANKLESFIQWVFVPAVKDASAEQTEAKNTALGKLLERTVRSKVKFDEEMKRLRETTHDGYQKMLAAHQSALDDISYSLAQRMAEWAHPDASVKLIWREDPKGSVRIEEPSAWIRAGESGFEGDLVRFGHGLQRCYILALLQELAQAGTGGGPRLILGCEEPELYQHPPQARHLADVLKKLSEANTQIILTTHSPLFVSGEQFETIRFVRRLDGSPATVRRATLSVVATRLKELTGTKYKKLVGAQAKLHSILQPHLSEMFFAARLVLVEGVEDVAYITAYLALTDRIGVGRANWIWPLPPPNRTGGSPAYGSPVGGVT